MVLPPFLPLLSPVPPAPPAPIENETVPALRLIIPNQKAPPPPPPEAVFQFPLPPPPPAPTAKAISLVGTTPSLNSLAAIFATAAPLCLIVK